MNRIKLPVLILSFFLTLPAFAKYSVLVVRPDKTAHYKRTDEPDLKIWEELLNDNDDFTVEIKPESILIQPIELYAMIILPMVLCLDDDALDDLERYLKKGGGILALGGIGCRDIDGEWRGYDFLKEILGTTPKELSNLDDTDPIGLRLRYGVPGTVAVDPDLWLSMDTDDQFETDTPVLYLPLTDSVRIGGYWECKSEWMDIPVRQHPFRDSCAGYVTRRQPSDPNDPSYGRIAWFGANMNALPGDSIVRKEYTAFFHQLSYWLCGENVVGIEPWQRRKKVALLIHGDIKGYFTGEQGRPSSRIDRIPDITNVMRIIRLFARLDVATTFHMLTDVVAQHPQIIATMKASGGELAIIADNGHPLLGQSLETQLQRLTNAINIVSLYTERPHGIHPVGYDDNTIEAMRLMGLTYIITDDLADRYYPYFSDGIVFFPKGHLYRDAATVNSDFNRIYNLGGLYPLYYSDQSLSDDPDIVPDIGDIIRRIQKDSSVWIASAIEISRWIKQRQSLELTVIADGRTGLPWRQTELSVVNRSGSTLQGVVLRIISPWRTASMALISASEEVSLEFEDGYSFIALPDLAPEEPFEAILEWKGEIPDRDSASRTLLGLMKLFTFIIVAFVGWTFYYFVFSRRGPIVIRNEDDDNNTPHHPVHED